MAKEKIFYFGYDTLLLVHSKVLNYSRGETGVSNEKLLKGCLDFIQDDQYYPTFEDKITHLVFSIAMNHGFVDGNKRTAIIAGMLFLIINGYPMDIYIKFPRVMENAVLLLVEKKISKPELHDIISGFLNCR